MSEAADLEGYVVDLNARCTCGCMEGDRFHKIYRFPNGYGASVVSNPRLFGFSREGYRVLLIEFDSDTEYHVLKRTPISNGVLECPSWRDVEELLHRTMRLDLE
jgi:hypothetical protein